MDVFSQVHGDMRADMGQITHKLENLKTQQEHGHQENVNTHDRIQELEGKIAEIRKLTAARCLSDGQSVIRVINSFNREQRQLQTSEAAANYKKKINFSPGSPKKH